MSTFSTLPWFIVTNIIKQVCFKKPFSRQLQLLWICSRWRLLGVPLVFSCAYLLVGKDSSVIQTNFDLVLNSGMGRAVTRLDINASLEHTPFTPYLVPLLEILNNGKLAGWPSSYQKMLPEVSEKELDSPDVLLFHYEAGPTLPDELLTKAKHCLAGFSKKLSNVKELDFRMSSKTNLGVQFAGVLFGAFPGQITNLSYVSSVPRHMTQFPVNLTKLEYVCGARHHKTISFANARTLESLSLLNVPSGMPWYKCFGDMPVSQTALAFPQLRDLRVTYLGERSDGTFVGYQKLYSEVMTIRMPQLEKLRWEDTQSTLDSDLNLVLPSRLDSVYLDISIQGFIYFSQLPITSIKYLYASVDFKQGTGTFSRPHYQATNRMFGEIANAGTTCVMILNDVNRVGYHPQCSFNWSNIRYLKILAFSSSMLVKALSNMPKLQVLHIQSLLYIDNEVSQLCPNTTIQRLTLLRIGAELPSGHKIPRYLAGIVEMLGGLTFIHIPEKLVPAVEQHLKDINRDVSNLEISSG